MSGKFLFRPKYQVKNFRALWGAAKLLKSHADGGKISFSRGHWDEPVFKFARKGEPVECLLMLNENVVLVGGTIVFGSLPDTIQVILALLDEKR